MFTAWVDRGTPSLPQLPYVPQSKLTKTILMDFSPISVSRSDLKIRPDSLPGIVGIHMLT